MPRKPLDIKLTDYPFSRERSKQLLSLPSRRGTGVGRAHKTQISPSEKPGLMFQLFWDIFKNA